jgi:hypothetical protein
MPKKGSKSPGKKGIGSKKSLAPPVWTPPPPAPPKLMDLPVDVKHAAEVGDLMSLRTWLAAGHVDATYSQPERRAPANAPRRGVTMLMAASAAGQMRAVVMLLDNGASVDAQDSNGDSALMIASKRRGASCGSQEAYDHIATYLVRNGANIDLADNNGATARSHLPYSTCLVLRELEGRSRGPSSLSLGAPPGLGSKGRGQSMANLSVSLIEQRPAMSSHSRLPYLRLGRDLATS